MIGKTLLEFPSLQEGVLIRRYKRFLAEVELSDGEIVTAHCANTGPMKGVLKEGGLVRLRYSPSPARKLDWSWEQSQVKGANDLSVWVGVNTAMPNKLVKLAIEAGLLDEQLGEIKSIKAEVPYGKDNKSRIDLLLTPLQDIPDAKQIYIEIKNTTWNKGPMALFPDTVTKRGQKHLKELIALIPNFRSVLVPSISRPDLNIFAPGDEADPTYGELFRLAIQKGVEVLPCSFGFYKNQITWEGIRPYKETSSS